MSQRATDFLKAATRPADKPALKEANNTAEITVEQVFEEVFSSERIENFTLDNRIFSPLPVSEIFAPRVDTDFDRFQTILRLPDIFSQLCLKVAPPLMKLWLYGEMPKVESRSDITFKLIDGSPLEKSKKLYLETQLELFDWPLVKTAVAKAEAASLEALRNFFSDQDKLRRDDIPALRRQRNWPDVARWEAAKEKDEFTIGDFSRTEFPSIRVHTEKAGDDLSTRVGAYLSGIPSELDQAASLGAFHIHVYFKGKVIKQADGKGRVVIDRRGIRLYDKFNFNDGDAFFSQPLGAWAKLEGAAQCAGAPKFTQSLLQLQTRMAGVFLSNRSLTEFQQRVMNRVNNRLDEHARARHRVTRRRLKCRDFDIFTKMKEDKVDPPQKFQVEF